VYRTYPEKLMGDNVIALFLLVSIVVTLSLVAQAKSMNKML